MNHCNSKDVINRNASIWHDNDSKPHTEVLVYVSYRYESKRLVIGTTERAWGYVSNLELNKRSHLSAYKIDNQSTIYTTSILNKARVKWKELEKPDFVLSE